MKIIFIIIGLTLITWPSQAEVDTPSSTSNISSSALMPPKMEFEEVEKQLKSFLVTNPVDLSQHFAFHCSYSITRIQEQQLFQWILRYENQTNQNFYLEHSFGFNPNQPVKWHGYRIGSVLI